MRGERVDWRPAYNHDGLTTMATIPDGLRLRQRVPVPARARAVELPPNLRRYAETGEALIAEPFRGITADGAVTPDLFPIQATGVSTRPLLDAATAFLNSLHRSQRSRALFDVDSDAWRRWSNIHPFVMRHGVPLDELTATQRERALALLRESLSVGGFRTARDVMRLNEYVRVMTGSDAEYGEWLYWVSVMGTPSADAPWGWQLDGHHLIVNCFVLGDQVVMTPLFMGSEPVGVDTGPLAGTRVFQPEEQQGLALVRSLAPEQRRRAVLAAELPVELFTAAFRDNVALTYEGVRFGELTTAQQRLLVDVLRTYVGRIREGHATVRLEEVTRHLAETWFAWMGGVDEDDVFYYRLHSPVILVEFDHQRGIVFDNDAPSRHHIHTVVRTPNGNDYGCDLLRQHHARFDHARPGHRHG
jgi:hypothetical protein